MVGRDLYTRANKKFNEANELLPNSNLNFQKHKNPMVILEKMESLVNESKKLYLKADESGFYCKDDIGRCNVFLKDIGRYYSWLGSYYFERATKEKSHVASKYYAKKAQKCFDNYKRLTEDDPVRERVRSR